MQRDLRLLEVRFSPSKRVTKELLGGWQVVALNVLSKEFLVTGTWNLVYIYIVGFLRGGCSRGGGVTGEP